MVIGTLSLALHLHGVHSLKEKRRVVKRILLRVRNTFNVSAAEVADLDAHERSRLAFVSTGNDARKLNSRMDKILNFIEEMHLAEIVAHSIDVFHEPDVGEGF